MTEDQISEFKNICKLNHWKCTPQRMMIFSFMCGNESHPCVDDVWSAVKHEIHGITRETAFRILCDFADRGLIARMDNLCSARFDANPAPHGHFFCMQCGAIADFRISDDFHIPEELSGHLITHQEMRLTGICDKCRALEQNSSSS